MSEATTPAVSEELLDRLKDKIVSLCGRRLVDCIDDLQDILSEIDKLAGVCSHE